MIRTEGPKSLYNGLVAGLQRQVCFASIRIGLYDNVKNFYTGGKDSKWLEYFKSTLRFLVVNFLIHNISGSLEIAGKLRYLCDLMKSCGGSILQKTDVQQQLDVLYRQKLQ